VQIQLNSRNVNGVIQTDPTGLCADEVVPVLMDQMATLLSTAPTPDATRVVLKAKRNMKESAGGQGTPITSPARANHPETVVFQMQTSLDLGGVGPGGLMSMPDVGETAHLKLPRGDDERSSRLTSSSSPSKSRDSQVDSLHSSIQGLVTVIQGERADDGDRGKGNGKVEANRGGAWRGTVLGRANSESSDDSILSPLVPAGQYQYQQQQENNHHHETIPKKQPQLRQFVHQEMDASSLVSVEESVGSIGGGGRYQPQEDARRNEKEHDGDDSGYGSEADVYGNAFFDHNRKRLKRHLRRPGETILGDEDEDDASEALSSDRALDDYHVEGDGRNVCGVSNTVNK